MKNILVLTKIYPSNDILDGDTKVVHYFVKHWQAMGYNVLVVHNFIQFPWILCKLTKIFQRTLSSRFGAVVPSVYAPHILKYKYEDIDVVRVPIKKYIPHGNFSEAAVLRHFRKIETVLNNINFSPDIVVGHWWNPQFQLMSHFKDRYNCRTCIVAHDMPFDKLDGIFERHSSKVDVWGMRSGSLMKLFRNKYGNNYNLFHCASGVPEKYILGNDDRKFDNNRINIVYAGTLIKRKYPISIIEAISNLSDKSAYKVTYVGDGRELQTLKKTVFDNGLDNVMFLGRVERDVVSSTMKESDVFVMISRAEAFGLVYLEAMGCGCITIASRNEGMDGIIVDGENGFLCEAGNSQELASILMKIRKMTEGQRREMSDKAVKTAMLYTDRLAAERYLYAVMNE